MRCAIKYMPKWWNRQTRHLEGVVPNGCAGSNPAFGIFFIMNFDILKNLPFIKHVRYFKEISSTNDKAIENLDESEFTVFIAESQTKGRGRNKRQWYSPYGKNLYFSFIVKPNIDLKYFSSIPVLTAYSIYKTLNNYILKNIFIKWPNDIFIEDRKISGTLIEIVKNILVIGVGINVNIEKLPDFDNNIPTSIYLETGKELKRELVLKEFFEEFYKNYIEFVKIKKLSDKTLNEIEEVLKFKGETVEILFKDSVKKGKIVGITEHGYLKLDNDMIYAGDVLKVKR